MDYFEWFGLERKFVIDQALLRKAFLNKSMELHPDKAGIDEQKSIELSGYNNQAYSTLKDEVLRFEYILTTEGVIRSGEKPVLPQEFLMEMLDMNMEIEMAKENGDKDTLARLDSGLEAKKRSEELSIEPLINQYDSSGLDEAGFQKLKNFYYIRKYLLRIEESIHTFASR